MPLGRLQVRFPQGLLLSRAVACSCATVRVTHQNPPKSHALAFQVSYIKREKGTAYIASRDVYTMRTKGACIVFGDIAICIMKINDGGIMENITTDQSLRITEKVMEKFGDAIGGNPQIVERIMFGVIDSACENDDDEED